MSAVDKSDVLSPSELPSLSTINLLDAILAKIHIALDDHFSKTAVSIILS